MTKLILSIFILSFILITNVSSASNIVTEEYYGPYEDPRIDIKDGYLTIKDGKNKKVLGPYEEKKVNKVKYPPITTEGNKQYIVINNIKHGPYDSVFPIGSSGAFIYTKDGQSYLNLKDKDYGPYDDFDRTAYSSTKSGIAYQKSNKQYINIDGTEYGPYDKFEYVYMPSDMVLNFTPLFINDKDWGFVCQRDNKHYAIINNKQYGPYDAIFDLNSSPAHWGFGYKLANEYYINIDGTEYGPYESIEGGNVNFIDFKNDDWGFAYGKNNKRYVKITGQDYGPYELRIKEFAILNNDKFVIDLLSYKNHNIHIVSYQKNNPLSNNLNLKPINHKTKSKSKTKKCTLTSKAKLF